MLTEIKNKKISVIQNYALLLTDYNKIKVEYEKNVRLLEELVEKKKNYKFVKKISNKKDYKELINLIDITSEIIKDLELKKIDLANRIQQFITMRKDELTKFNICLNYEEYYIYFKPKYIIEKINSMKTIRDFNMTFEGAVEYLKANNLPIYLEEDDKVIINNDTDFEDLSEFVLVHLTNYMPSNNHITTSLEANDQVKTVFLDKVGSMEYANKRNTVHFSVNGEVRAHAFGSWEDAKYAFVIPFEDMPISKLRSGAVMDSFFEGGIDLPESAIFICPLDEVSIAQSLNDRIKVIGYKGDNVKWYADALVGMLGKKVEGIGMWGWNNRDDEAKYYKTFSSIFPSVEAHTESFEVFQEKIYNNLSCLLAFSDKLIDEKMILTEKDIVEILGLKNRAILDYHPYHLEKNEVVFEYVITNIQEYLSKINTSLSENVVENVRKYYFSYDTKVTEEELEYYNSKLMDSNKAIPSFKYAHLLLLDEFLSIINNYIQQASLNNEDINYDKSENGLIQH